MLAVPFAFGPMRSTGTGARTVVGIMIGVVFFLMAKMLESGGAVFDLPPIVDRVAADGAARADYEHCGGTCAEFDDCGAESRVLRRFGAMLYDLLVVLALLIIATALFLPFTGGEAITPERSARSSASIRLALLVVIVLFFGFFWTRRGQTLGMLAWRSARRAQLTEALLTWRDALRTRLGGARACRSLALGLGLLLDLDRSRPVGLARPLERDAGGGAAEEEALRSGVVGSRSPTYGSSYLPTQLVRAA